MFDTSALRTAYFQFIFEQLIPDPPYLTYCNYCFIRTKKDPANDIAAYQWEAILLFIMQQFSNC
ncbi:hypothetical protein HMPREF9412_2581 [Paenibacillus sp. HGF5]|nr:hypothetical protein HMPREF9412_2581 [Paenibacillus sp. HGF5]